MTKEEFKELISPKHSAVVVIDLQSNEPSSKLASWGAFACPTQGTTGPQGTGYDRL